MNLRAIPHEMSYQLDPNMPYRRGEMSCHIVEFLSEHRAELQELAVALETDYPRIAQACRDVVANPTNAQGNTCKTLGDVIIALQTPDDAVLWTSDASFEVICPTLGIEFLRESLQA